MPEANFPRLQPPPGNENLLQQVSGPAVAGARINVKELFNEADDPFQSKAPKDDDAAKNQAGVPPNSAGNSQNPPTSVTPVIKPADGQSVAQVAPIPPAATTVNPPKIEAPNFDNVLKDMQKNPPTGNLAGPPVGKNPCAMRKPALALSAP